MPSQTELIFSTLGKRDPLRLIAALARGEATESGLADRANIDKAAASRGLAQLRLLGLVERESVKSPYRLVFPDLTQQLLARAQELAREISLGRDSEHLDLETLMKPDGDTGST